MTSNRKQIHSSPRDHHVQEITRSYPHVKELLQLLKTDVLELVRNADSEVNELLASAGKINTLESECKEIQSINEELERRLVHQEKQRNDKNTDALNVKIRQLEKRLSHEERCKLEVERKVKRRSDEHKENTDVLKETLRLAEEEIKTLHDELVATKRNESILQNKLETLHNFDQLLVINQLKEELKSTKTELEETKSRLSKVMGDKLTDNNPNIADLSDKNRPTKLAERYQEIYDNEWTDAFETLDAIYNDEEKTISVLKNILMETNEFCRRQAEYQVDQIQEALYQSKSMPKYKMQSIQKNVKDCRKTVAEISGEHIHLKYKKDLSATKSALSKQVRKVPYFEEACFSLCWLMAVQDPPIVIGSDIRQGDHFDSDLFRAYTRSGKKLKYVVWPALYLHINGPILCKGVAQGYTDISRRSQSVPDKNRKEERTSKRSPECYNKSFEHTKLNSPGSKERNTEDDRTKRSRVNDSIQTNRERKFGMTQDTPVRGSRTRNKAKSVRQNKVHTLCASEPSESDIDTFLRWREMFGHFEAKRLMGDDYDICLKYLSELNII